MGESEVPSGNEMILVAIATVGGCILLGLVVEGVADFYHFMVSPGHSLQRLGIVALATGLLVYLVVRCILSFRHLGDAEADTAATQPDDGDNTS